MDNNLKFTDLETELFYEMIAEWTDIHFIDNSEISFLHLYKLWEIFIEENIRKIALISLSLLPSY